MDDYFVADEDQVEAIVPRLCPVACPHKREELYVRKSQLKKNSLAHHFHGFLHGYWCEKYRSVLGSHALRPFRMALGDGDLGIVVMKSPFCPDNPNN